MVPIQGQQIRLEQKEVYDNHHARGRRRREQQQKKFAPARERATIRNFLARKTEGTNVTPGGEKIVKKKHAHTHNIQAFDIGDIHEGLDQKKATTSTQNLRIKNQCPEKVKPLVELLGHSFAWSI